METLKEQGTYEDVWECSNKHVPITYHNSLREECPLCEALREKKEADFAFPLDIVVNALRPFWRKL